MPKIQKTEIPETVRPYHFHGVQVNWGNPTTGGDGRRYAIGDCPFCGKGGKFHIDLDDGLCGCFVCQIKGNKNSFLTWLYEKSIAVTTEYSPLSVANRLLNGVGLASWGICKSVLSDSWLVPGWTADGKLFQLYKYTWNKASNRMVTMPTPGIGHGLHGVNLFDSSKLIVFLCEGWKDGVALWEIMSQTKETDDGNKFTSNQSISLLKDANVLATPSANTFSQSWMPLFAGRAVVLMYDNDHPRVNEQTGEEIEGAGLAATKRAAKILNAASKPPEQISYLKWGDLGYNKELPSGFDVRDLLTGKI